MRFISFYLFLLFPLIAVSNPVAVNPADAVLGQYWGEDNRYIIEMYKEGGQYKGRFVWHIEDEKKDENNPNPDLQNRPLVGLTFLTDFQYYERGNRWTDGKAYAADDGSTYSGKIWLEDPNTLKMRGYIGISLFGRTATFIRIAAGKDIPK